MDVCRHCGIPHDCHKTSCNIPEANFYVVSHDLFFSDEDYVNMPVVPCDTQEDAEAIAAYIRSRGDQKSIKIHDWSDWNNNLAPHIHRIKLFGSPVVFNLLSAWSKHRAPVVPSGAIWLTFTWGSIAVTCESKTHKIVGRAGGGGYDRKGAALADWLEVNWLRPLWNLHDRAFYKYMVTGKKPKERFDRFDVIEDTWQGVKAGRLYGMSAYYRGEPKQLSSVSLDGACGFEEMVKVVEAAGWKMVMVSSNNDRKPVTETWALFKEKPHEES